MATTVLDHSAVVQLIAMRWPREIELLRAEVLRALLWANRWVTRRTLVDQACRLLEAGSREDWLDACDELERRGDVTAATRGRLAAAPMRLIRLANEYYCIFGGPDSKTLGIENSDLMRRCKEDQARRIVSEYKALELSPERWAGLKRFPIADQIFLDSLTQALAISPTQAGPIANISSDAWQGYVKGQWRSLGKDREALLWRAKGLGGWYRYYWTSGGSPEVACSMRLSRDEACRSGFAQDKSQKINKPISDNVTHGNVSVELPLLPRAEYRFCLVAAEPSSTPKSMVFEAQNWDPVKAMLKERLGLVFGSDK